MRQCGRPAGFRSPGGAGATRAAGKEVARLRLDDIDWRPRGDDGAGQGRPERPVAAARRRRAGDRVLPGSRPSRHLLPRGIHLREGAVPADKPRCDDQRRRPRRAQGPGWARCTRTECVIARPPRSAAGAPLAEIGRVLRHRAALTTAIYANSRVLHQPGEKPQVSRSRRGRNSVPCLRTAAV